MAILKSKLRTTVESTRFSEFIRNASSKEKKRVYSDVIRKATEMQNGVISRAGNVISHSGLKAKR